MTLTSTKKKTFSKEQKNDQKNEYYTEAENVYETHMIPVKCMKLMFNVALHLIYRTLCSDLKTIFFFGGGEGVEGAERDGGDLSYI